MVLREEPVTHEERTLTSVADENGNFRNTEYSPEEHDLGVKYTLIATGQSSGKTAQTQFTDSNTAGGTGARTDFVYSSSTGASIVPGTTDIGNHCDDCTTLITLPFNVAMYGKIYTKAQISSNGNIQFESNSREYNNFFLPGTGFDGEFKSTIFALWDDLRTDGSSSFGANGIYTSVSGSAPNRIFNVEWRTHRYGDASRQYNFEIRLYENQQRFDIIYGRIDENGGGATVGVQKDSTSYTQYAANEAGTITQGQKLSFYRAIKTLTVGANRGNRATEIAYSRGDILGSVTHVNETQFNAMSASDLQTYDVILIQWDSSHSLDVNWSKVSNYVENGGGFIFDGDPNNINDLSPAVTSNGSSSGGSLTITPVPILTDGLSPHLTYPHFRIGTYDSTIFKPFLHDAGGNLVGIYGTIGRGRIIVTGPDPTEEPRYFR